MRERLRHHVALRLLLQAIVADRAEGYSLVDREAEPGFRSISVPVRRYDGMIVAAIVDVVEEAIVTRARAQRDGVLHTAVIDGRVTELIDIDGIIRTDVADLRPAVAWA